MIGTFEVINGQTKITFEAIADTTTVISVVGDASEYLWNHGYGDHGPDEAPISFEDLTNQQKLDIVAIHLQSIILDLANSFKSEQAQKQARDYEESNQYQF